MMEIIRSIDIEDAVRGILSGAGLTAYCRPLPEGFTVPSLLITATGGTDVATWSGEGRIDNFTFVIDSRAESDAGALAQLRDAIAVLRAAVSGQAGVIRSVTLNTQYSWGQDPVRPDLAMCSANLTARAHLEKVTI